ncbi:MAG: hypothetical protein ACR2JU_16715 [Nocardioidaceae bacterium]
MAGSYPRLAAVTDLDGPFPCAQRAARQTSRVAPGEISTAMTGQHESEAYSTPHPGNPVGRPGHDTASSEWREVQS